MTDGEMQPNVQTHVAMDALQNTITSLVLGSLLRLLLGANARSLRKIPELEVAVWWFS